MTGTSDQSFFHNDRSWSARCLGGWIPIVPYLQRQGKGPIRETPSKYGGASCSGKTLLNRDDYLDHIYYTKRGQLR